MRLILSVKRQLPGLVLIAFVLLSLLYAWVTPPLEASDEYWHVGMVDYVHQQRDLAVQDPDQPETLWRQQGSQPPLYYLVAALLTAPIPRDDVAAARVVNPHARLGEPDSVGNKNRIVPADVPITHPAHASVLILRGFGILLGIISLSATYTAARLLMPEQPGAALLAAGLLAFNPMFLFISASVNNDNLVTALSSVAIVLALGMLRRGFDTRRSLLIALVVALATLSKLSGLVLVPTIAGLALWIAWRDRDWRGLVILGVLMAVAWLVLAGWWYLRNLTLYGELFGTGMMVQIAGARLEPFTLATALAEFEGFRWSYWGVFGGFNIIIPQTIFYALMDGLTVLAGLGLLIGMARLVRWRGQAAARDQLAGVLFLLAVLGVGLIAFLQWTAQTYASQGRLLFPYNAAILSLMAYGLWTLAGRLRALWAVPVAGLGVVALLIPFGVIAPHYAVPVPIAGLPSEVTPIYARFGSVALVGYQVEQRRYLPGERVPVTLYWQVEAPSTADDSLFLTLLDPAGEAIGTIDSYPGAGKLRSSRWDAGTLYADRYAVPIAGDASGHFALRLHVGWWQTETGRNIPAVDEAGEPIGAVLLDVGALGAGEASASAEGFTLVSVDFGGVIGLRGYQRDGDQVALYWQALAKPDDSYTVFVQGIEEGEVIVQGDAPPVFPTRYWRPGETFITTHTLTTRRTPGGALPLFVGWYHPSDFRRLSVDAPDNAYPIMVLPGPS